MTWAFRATDFSPFQTNPRLLRPPSSRTSARRWDHVLVRQVSGHGGCRFNWRSHADGNQPPGNCGQDSLHLHLIYADIVGRRATRQSGTSRSRFPVLHSSYDRTTRPRFFGRLRLQPDIAASELELPAGHLDVPETAGPRGVSDHAPKSAVACRTKDVPCDEFPTKKANGRKNADL